MSRPPATRSPLPPPPNQDPNSWEWRLTQAVDDLQRRLAAAQNEKFLHSTDAQIAAYSPTDARRFHWSTDGTKLYYEADGNLYQIYPTAAGAVTTVEEVDGNPSIAPADTIQFPNGTLSEPVAGTARYTPAAATLTVREVDTSPSVTATTIEFPNGTLSEPVGGTARYTPAAAALSVTDNTTTVSSTDSIEFDPTYFDVIDNGSGDAEVTFVGSAGGAVDPWKESVRCASTANVAISNGLENGDSIDGVTLATGDRVLLKDQTDATENGIYVAVASGAASRSTDADVAGEFHKGIKVYVRQGTVNHDTTWSLTTDPTITLGSTSITFKQEGNAIFTSTYANFPTTTGVRGDVYLATDNNRLGRSTGAVTQPYGPIVSFTDLASGDWTISNAANNGYTFTSGNLRFQHTGATGTNIRYLYRSIQSTPYTIVCVFNYNIPNFNFPQMGIGFVQSSSGKLVLFGVANNSGVNDFFIQKMTNVTTFSATYAGFTTYRWSPQPLTMKMTDDGTNLVFSVSWDLGTYYHQLLSVSRTDFMLTTGPDRECIWIDTTTTTTPNPIMHVYSYSR